jgi:mRNA deadenylase 3'-5' endonuclease subunit Ccr4/uncharacterized protein with PIN domain
MKQLKKKKVKRKTPKGSKANDTPPKRWVEELSFQPVDAPHALNNITYTPNSKSLTVISWNVLAEAYCSRRSHPHLPKSYQSKVFDRKQRKERILEILTNMVHNDNNHDDNNDNKDNQVDIFCLQEVDLDEIGQTFRELGYEGIETERTVAGGGAGGRSDACVIYWNADRWTLVEHELVRLDDLATLSSTSTTESSTAETASTSSDGKNGNGNDCSEGDDDNGSNSDGRSSNYKSSKSYNNGNGNNNLQGLQQTFLRRNVALICRLRDNVSGTTLVVANAHLYWNPACEHVKLCQAHYILQRAQAFLNNNGNGNTTTSKNSEPLIFCGDLNSRPNSITHSYLTRGSINAKHTAPWYRHSDEEYEYNDKNTPTTKKVVVDDDTTDDNDEKKEQAEVLVVDQLISNLQITASTTTITATETQQKQQPPNPDIPRVRYMLDATLNKLCRWLRILGQDVALETEEEERLRTKENDMVVFQRCLDERRTLVTTSTRLMQRRDCPPGTYCISPVYLPTLEVAMIHMLLNHGVVLEPNTFLTRCVVCNGMICEVHEPTEKRRILQDYQAPSDLSEVLEVYECDGCKQGYWWCDRPTSSASRVKTQATRLFELCLRAGVPIKGDVPHLFTFVDIQAERERGWDYTEKGSELLKQQLDVVDWLRDEHLSCPFGLESAYAFKDDNGCVVGETLPFTNVTYSFVNTLDYIFFDKEHLTANEILDIPTSFPQLNEKGIGNGHLLPSDVWPSDHLAIGARLSFAELDRDGADGEKEELPALQFCMPLGAAPPPSQPASASTSTSSEHKPRCDCGCVPPIKSMFEMAELRKQARLKKAADSK